LYVSEHIPTISLIILKAVPANGIVSTILPTAFITPPKISFANYFVPSYIYFYKSESEVYAFLETSIRCVDNCLYTEI
jgi:hypothetical protein